MKANQEDEKQQIAVLGPELGPLYSALHNEVVLLHVKWQEYRHLYGTSPQRLKVINETAGFFFLIIGEVLWDDVLMHIARLTDEPNADGKRRLSFRHLSGKVDHPELSDKLRILLRIADSRADFVRGLRNNRLAHMNLDHAVAHGQAEELQEPSRKQIDDVLSAFSDILNAIRAHYFQGNTFGYERFHAATGAETLIHFLNAGLQNARQKHERRISGRDLPEDDEALPDI